MLIRDGYKLAASDPFKIENNEEVTINLALKKLPPCYRTLLFGRVLNTCGAVYQAAVEVFSLEMKPLFHTNTDISGYYQFKNIIPPGQYKVIASAKYHKTSQTRIININNDTVKALSFLLLKSKSLTNGIIYGKVLEDRSNLPIEGATVFITGIDTYRSQSYEAITNKDGEYVVYNINPGQYLVKATKSGYITQEAAEVTVDTYSQTMLNVHLIKNSSVWKGTVSGVIASGGIPAANIAVFLYGIDGHGNENMLQLQMTNEEGNYLFGKLDKGTYIIKASMENGEEYTAIEIID